MFRQIKSALFWYYLYRFRRRVALILTLLVLIILSEYIYSDILQYLQLRHKTEWLDIILPLKWLVIFSAIFAIFVLILGLFQATKSEEKSKEPPPHKPLKKMSKSEIRDLAKNLIERKRSSKTKTL